MCPGLVDHYTAGWVWRHQQRCTYTGRCELYWWNRDLTSMADAIGCIARSTKHGHTIFSIKNAKKKPWTRSISCHALTGFSVMIIGNPIIAMGFPMRYVMPITWENSHALMSKIISNGQTTWGNYWEKSIKRGEHWRMTRQRPCVIVIDNCSMQSDCYWTNSSRESASDVCLSLKWLEILAQDS